MNTAVIGHMLAFGTMLVWGTTFISTKVLLIDFTPIEILFTRFFIGFFALLILMPHLFGLKKLSHELTFAAAGFFGVTLYFLFENVALTYTQAANVGVIIGTVPFFTAIVDRLFGSKQKLHSSFFLGFIAAMIGIALISVSSMELQINPLGDCLALLASVTWAFYTLYVRKAGTFGYNTMQVTRRVFMYGLIWMIPFMYLFNFELKFDAYIQPVNLFNLLFLGVGASAVCFFTWNFAVKVIGSVQTAPYLYAAPAVTVVAAVLILDEIITPRTFFGIVLTMLGLLVSEWSHLKLFFKKKEAKAEETAAQAEPAVVPVKAESKH